MAGWVGEYHGCRSSLPATRLKERGDVDRLSVPPATISRSMPARMLPAAIAMAERPAAQWRLSANPGTLSKPRRTAVWRAMDPPPAATRPDEIVQGRAVDAGSLDDSRHSHLGQGERIDTGERALVRAANKGAQAVADNDGFGQDILLRTAYTIFVTKRGFVPVHDQDYMGLTSE